MPGTNGIASTVMSEHQKHTEFLRHCLRYGESAEHQALVSSITEVSGTYITKEIPQGVAIKKADMIKELFECDVYIDIPIFKHHGGTILTGCLKNVMGACSGTTNRFFHSGSTQSGAKEDLGFLAQAIADANLAVNGNARNLRFGPSDATEGSSVDFAPPDDLREPIPYSAAARMPGSIRLNFTAPETVVAGTPFDVRDIRMLDGIPVGGVLRYRWGRPREFACLPLQPVADGRFRVTIPGEHTDAILAELGYSL